MRTASLLAVLALGCVAPPQMTWVARQPVERPFDRAQALCVSQHGSGTGLYPLARAEWERRVTACMNAQGWYRERVR